MKCLPYTEPYNALLIDVSAVMRQRFRTKKYEPDMATMSDDAQESNEEGYFSSNGPSGADAARAGPSGTPPAQVPPTPSTTHSKKNLHQDPLERPHSQASVATSQGSVRRHSSMRNLPLNANGTQVPMPTDDEGDEEVDEHAFDHPSTYKPAPIIWVPKDSLGLSEGFLVDLKEAGIEASELGASMNEHARVKVS